MDDTRTVRPAAPLCEPLTFRHACPACTQTLNEHLRCQNPHCEHFGAAIRAALTPEVEGLLGRMLFVLRDLAEARIHLSLGDCDSEAILFCQECQFGSLNGKLYHRRGCDVGLAMELMEKITFAVAGPESGPSHQRRKEDAPCPESAGGETSTTARRVAAAIAFCHGIPTAVLERELPLAASERRQWHEIQHLPLALPWLREIREADERATGQTEQAEQAGHSRPWAVSA